MTCLNFLFSLGTQCISERSVASFIEMEGKEIILTVIV